MPEVTVYSTRICPYCVAAKRLLSQRGIAYREIDVTGDDAKRAWLLETTKRRTVPQIFIGEQAIGGFDELAAMDKSGELARRLSPAA
jgi:glutaredoxin 3